MKDFKNLEGFDGVKDWATWRTNVKERIAVGHRFGVPDETIRAIGVKIGDYLADTIFPTTREEELLRQMWKVATPEEKNVIATLVFKIVQ